MSEENSFTIDSMEMGFVHLKNLLDARLKEYLPVEAVLEYQWVKYTEVAYNEALFQEMVKKHQMSNEEILILLIALAPLLHPELLEILLEEEVKYHVSKGAVGLKMADSSRTVFPTVRTALFILGHADEQFFSAFRKEHFFIRENILKIEGGSEGLSLLDFQIAITEEYEQRFTLGYFEPQHGQNFPAQKISTSQDWEDLVIRQNTLEQIEEIKQWIKHEQKIMSNPAMAKKIKKGYRALFYGSSGTGKTMTASLLGKSFQMPVFRVDLSMVVSKYIGETEKNLEKIFNMAESRNWILFFDEAEALFGKRGASNDAHDRYANQEISYLLQRIENFDSVLILATNKLFELDEAFTRRFQSMIEFPEPNAAERLALWHKTFDDAGFYYDNVDFENLAATKDITGGMLINVLRFAAIRVMERDNNRLTQEDLILGLKKEYSKDNRMWVDVPVQNRRQSMTLQEYAKQKI